MPCFSRITVTQITDISRLMQALRSLNIDAKQVNALTVTTFQGNFTRSKEGQAFIFDGGVGNLAPIGRKYAELSVKSFAQKRGLTIQAQDEKQMVLIKR